MSQYGDPSLFNEMNNLTNELSESIKALKQYGLAKASAEREYQTIKSQTALQMKTEGDAVTMIQLRLKGVPAVAKAMFDRDRAETMYEVARENINILKLHIRILDAQISREWGSND